MDGRTRMRSGSPNRTGPIGGRRVDVTIIQRHRRRDRNRSDRVVDGRLSLACDTYDPLVSIRPSAKSAVRWPWLGPTRHPRLGRIMTATLINTLRGSDGGIAVEVRGEIDVASAERLRQVLTDASRQRPTVLVVDLLYVTFIDSTGIGALAAG
jgi:STAS domain